MVTLFALPEPCMVHALLFLVDLDDLLNFASTSSAAAVLLRSHWSRLKPDGAEHRRRFLAGMEALRLSTPSIVSSKWHSLPPLPPPAPLLPPPEQQVEMRMIVQPRSNAYMSLGMYSEAAALRGTVLATSVRISARWKESPRACVVLSVGGQHIVRIDGDVARMELANDGSDTLDVGATMLHRLPMHLQFHGVSIANQGDVEAEVCWTEHRRPDLFVDPGQSVVWRMHLPTTPESPVAVHAAADTVRFPRIAPLSHVVDYLVIHGRGRILPPVVRFTLIARGRHAEVGAATAVVAEEETHHIPGWACRVAGGYKVPLGGLNLCRMYNHSLEVKFSRPIGGMDKVVAYARAGGVATELGGMMGMLV